MRHSILIAALLLFSIPAVAADKWTRVQSKNFVLVGSASENQIRGVAEDLEVFRTAFSRFFTQVKEGSSVETTVMVFKSDDAFKPFKPVYKGKPANISGFFQSGRDMNFIALAAEVETPRVIYHEYVHRLMSDNLGSLPPWFQEGFAECFSTLEIEGRDKKVRLGRAIAEHVALLNERTFMPLERLFSVVHGSPEYNEEEKQGLFYAQSWAFVHYMMFNAPERRTQFTAFLDALKNGRPAPQAFQEVFKTDLESFQSTFEAYIQQRMAWNLFELSTPGGLDRSKDMTARTLSEAEAEFYLGDLMLHIDRLPEAETHLAKAVKLDAKLGVAQAAMGRLLMEKNSGPESLAYLQRATQLDPNNYLAHYYYAAAIRSQKAPPTDAQWATIRTELLKSIELAPQFVEATEMLANVNLTRNTDMPQTVELLAKAINVSPGRDYLFLQLAYALSRTQQREAARPIVRSLLAKATLEAPVRQSAQNLVEFLDRAAATEATNRALIARDTREIPATDVSGDAVIAAPTIRRAPAPPMEPLETSGARRDVNPLPAGTARIRGVLHALECKDGVTLVMTVDGKLARLRSTTPETIKFTSYNSAVTRQVTCGPIPENGVPAEVLYRPRANGESIGEPLSVDFVEPATSAGGSRALPTIPGTTTVRGYLTALECSSAVTLTVNSEGKTLRFHSASVNSVAFLNGPNPDGTVNCEPIPAPGFPVTILYRPATSGNITGEPMVVQFEK